MVRDFIRDSVRDHCHITGEYRGAAHRACNINYFRIDPETVIIPVVFHNLKGYDAHHIMRAIAVQSDLSCILTNMEKNVFFSLGNLRFIDSCQFIQSSLDNLVKSNKPDSFVIMSEYEKDPNKLKLLLQKGVYPYEYVYSWERFDEETLPEKDAFYSKLKMEHITDEDYKHAQEVWIAFECKNLGDFYNLYLKTDVLLLADVFENFRETCLEHYNLDPAHNYTSPGCPGLGCLFKIYTRKFGTTHRHKNASVHRKGVCVVVFQWRTGVFVRRTTPILKITTQIRKPATSCTSTQITFTAGP